MLSLDVTFNSTSQWRIIPRLTVLAQHRAVLLITEILRITCIFPSKSCHKEFHLSTSIACHPQPFVIMAPNTHESENDKCPGLLQRQQQGFSKLNNSASKGEMNLYLAVLATFSIFLQTFLTKSFSHICAKFT